MKISADENAGGAERVEPRTFANLVLDLIGSFGCKPTPKAYEIFFAYASSAQSTVRAAVDEAAAPDHVLQSFDLDRIHYEHFRSADGEWERQEQSSEAIDVSLKEAVALIADHLARSEQHQSKLRSVSDEISSDMSPSQLKRLTASLASENDAVLRHGADMAAKLSGTQSQFDDLRSELRAARADGVTDELTGLRNARGFAGALEKELGAAVKQGLQFSLCLIDIDRFRVVNETHDTSVGDAVLQRIGRILRSRLGDRDIPCRFGGEEFAIVMPGRNAKSAYSAIEDIRTYIEQLTFSIRGTSMDIGPITASFGISVLQNACNSEDMIAQAAEMVNAVKDKGGNGVRVDTPLI